MIAKARVAKHPIHPMLVPFPFGLLLFSLFCDLAIHQTGDITWFTLGVYTMAAGVIGALLAALPGFVDLYSMRDWPVKKIGIWHMSINLLIVVLYLINLRWRCTMALQTGQSILSMVGVLLLGVSGWLGGEMVYVHGAGVVQDKAKL